MIHRVLRAIRSRFHPLLHLRRFGPTAALLRALDRPQWREIRSLSFAVRVRRISHASYITLGTTEPAVVEAFVGYLESRRISSFWDIGANFGYYGWLVKSLQPDATVVFFEPEPRNLELLHATIDRHRLSGVEIVEAAVSDRDGNSAFARDLDSGSDGSIADSGAFAVRTLALDSRGGEVDLIKIDVEGHEAEVLAGAVATIERARPTIFLECLDESSPALAFLIERGYVSRRLDDDNYLLEPRG